MLGPDYIEHFTDAAQGAMDEYTLRLVCIYAALIGSIDFEGDSAYSQAARKAALAAKDVQKAMNEEGRRAAREAAKAAAEAVAKSAEADLATLGTAMGALSKAMQWRLHNSARATAAGVQDVVSRDNLKMPANVQRAYLEVVAQAVARVNSGMAGYEQATREAVLKLARRGVSVVEYKSGAWAQADVAMRRHIRTQVVQAGSRNTLELLEETGHDLVQTSSHGGARESHAKWQGRVFSLSGKSKKYPPFYRETGYGSVDGLCGANCKHDFGIYVEGQQLRYERDPDGGDEKREERYQAEQKQRELERGIRAAKREATALEAAGLDNTKERLRLAAAEAPARAHSRPSLPVPRAHARGRRGIEGAHLPACHGQDLGAREVHAGQGRGHRRRREPPRRERQGLPRQGGVPSHPEARKRGRVRREPPHPARPRRHGLRTHVRRVVEEGRARHRYLRARPEEPGVRPDRQAGGGVQAHRGRRGADS